MTSESFDFDLVTRVTAGAVGPPGKRTFYLQVRQAHQIISLMLEKEQLRLLAERLQELLANVSGARTMTLDMALEEPLVSAWRVGTMTLAYDEGERQFEVRLVELAEEGAKPATGHFEASLAQMQALVRHAVELISAGRPPCPMCGGPIDHDGGICPRLNGHRV